jgi:hypothetical protein
MFLTCLHVRQNPDGFQGTEEDKAWSILHIQLTYICELATKTFTVRYNKARPFRRIAAKATMLC